jgi:hypothetical protein
MANPPARFDYYALLVRRDETAVLLVPAGDGWSLPCLAGIEQQDLVDFDRLFTERLGARVTVLRSLEEPDDEEGGASVHQVEAHGEVTLPGARWFPRSELADLRLVPPEHRALIERALIEQESGVVPPRRNAWSLPGWFREAEEWIRAQAEQHGAALLGPVEQRKSWSISCILRAPTTAGTLYLKAAPPLFAHEPRLTATLASLFPGRVPEVLATDDERRWFLMREFRGPLLREIDDVELWEVTVRRLAEMQVACCDQGAWLLSLGCPDRRLPRLAEQIEALLADEATLRPDPAVGEGLTDEEIARLRGFAPDVAALCAEVDAGGVPASLIHSDLHPGNIVVTEDGPLLFDWTDACLAHPFLDACHLLWDAPKALSKKHGASEARSLRTRLEDAYLAAWERSAPREELRRLLARARPLSPLHQAVSYQGLTASVEDAEQKDWASDAPYFLRIALKALEEA